MITIEQIINNKINVNICYGWTSDYKKTIERIINAKTVEQRKIICIHGLGVYTIDNANKISAIISSKLFGSVGE